LERKNGAHSELSFLMKYKNGAHSELRFLIKRKKSQR